MGKVVDQQQDFSGGMFDALTPDRIPENCYRFGENIECRGGVARTRRGQRVIEAGIDAETEGVWEVAGSCVFTDAVGGEHTVAALVGGAGGGELRTRVVSADGSAAGYIVFPDDYEEPEGVEGVGADDLAWLFQYGGVLYLFRRLDGTAWKWDGNLAEMEWAAVATEPPEGGGEWMPQAAVGCVAFGRVWLAVKNPADYGVYDIVQASDITMADSEGLAWDIVKNNWQVGEKDRSDIVAMVPHASGSIVVLKRNSVWALNGCEGYLDALWVELIDGGHGAVGGSAALRVGADVWYLSDDGVRSIAAESQNGQRGVEIPVSRNISRFFDDRVLASSLRFLCAAAVFDSYALFTVPYGQARPNAVLAYDLEGGCWAGIWTHIDAAALHVMRTADGTGRILVAVGRNGRIERLLTPDRWGDEDADTALLVTRAFTCGAVERRKSYRTGLMGVSSAGARISVGAVDFDYSRETAVEHGVEVASGGWLLYIPDDGIDIPDEGLFLKDVDMLRRRFFVGMQARAMCLSIRVESGALDLRSIAVEASLGRAVSEF